MDFILETMTFTAKIAETAKKFLGSADAFVVSLCRKPLSNYMDFILETMTFTAEIAETAKKFLGSADAFVVSFVASLCRTTWILSWRP